MTFFVFDGENFNEVNTIGEAIKEAKEAIDCYADQCDPTWPEEVTNICYGMVIGSAVERPLTDEELESRSVVKGFEDAPFVSYEIDDPYTDYLKGAAEQADNRYGFSEIVQAVNDLPVTMIPAVLCEAIQAAHQKAVFRNPTAMVRFILRRMCLDNNAPPASIYAAVEKEFELINSGQAKQA